ncbi:MAG: C45 family autoproteolytic acyltransferase/hydrolase, partial [Acidimicrobiia bacterium]|nr:C45 family autoproteolytic acyltransferase/hydrolase [Acidimicrobiia bacterium]
MGSAHGDSYAEAIREYLDDRLATLGGGAWFGSEIEPTLAVEAAEASLTHHQQYSQSLFNEMESLATAAGISTAEAIVVGGFTDIVDIVRTRVGSAPILHECTGILNPVSGSLAQTWDMNMSAGAFVIMLNIQPESGPRALVQTTTGCLGQIGINEAGIGVGINNLASRGRPGVTWPFVVRRVLEQTSLDSAVAVVLEARLS